MEDQWLEPFIKKQKLKYFGHLKRSNDLEKIILEGIIDGKEKGKTDREGNKKGTYGMFSIFP